ncbi:MAG: DUF2391 family protein [Candidatus Aenigmarchaeota archaeon]|nr:DUF2391 family protein [Candidatus Aenigmarchaeota archaeon]
MPRKSKLKQMQPLEPEGVRVEDNVLKTPKGLYRIKTQLLRGNKLIATLQPLHFKFEARDLAQIFIGSIVLASPFMVTAEVWELGAQMSTMSSVLYLMLSLFALTILLYFWRYEKVTFEGHVVKRELMKRLVVTYLIAFATVAVLLTLLDKAPWGTDAQIAVKRVILVSLPACLGGAAIDFIFK